MKNLIFSIFALIFSIYVYANVNADDDGASSHSGYTSGGTMTPEATVPGR